MAFYTHYSFDLWLTLIKSNPKFKEERARYFFNHFNFKKKSLVEVSLAFRQVDLMVNAINEKTGKNVDADEMYLMVISIINDFDSSFSDIDLEQLYNAMELLVFTHMPERYCAHCLPVLETLKINQCTTNILSNTGFIKGKTLRKVLKALDIDQYIDFQLYSDEVRMSKPNQKFFQLMLDQVNCSLHPELSLHDIVHVGDNVHADIAGARAAGINSLLINSNKQSILQLLS